MGGCQGAAELVVAADAVVLGAAEAVAVAVEADGGGPATAVELVELVELAGWEEAAVAESVGVVEGPGG